MAGIFFYKKNYFPISLYRKLKYPIEEKIHKETWMPYPYGIGYGKYVNGEPIFSNRSYYNSESTLFFNNSYLIQLPRHYSEKIIIKSPVNLTIYRLLSPDNDNWIFNEWKEEDININVVGGSCSHNKIVSKKFNKGTIKLNPGGPNASSPIFLKCDNMSNLQEIKINNVNINIYLTSRKK